MNNYTRVSQKLGSVYIDSRKECKGWLFARRTIHQGEELVNHYGETYWLRQMASTSRKLAVVLAIFALYEQEYLDTKNPTEEQSHQAMSGYNGLFETVEETCKKWNNMTKKQIIAIFMRESLIF
ncbi:MAG: hypothetical protein EOP45_14210 [Sphingobacteriaceae bacterium]|nr:MAG: hypothetical protein EOP45_14210 [Sphingobacteriaceae bacterium]